eukprot:scaffold9090_cov76-Cyclotella_meneghiniana.AAC.3
MGKYAKNTSTIVQPSDHIPHHGLQERANKMFMRLRNIGDLVVTAEKMGMMSNAVSRYLSICRLSYSKKSINKSFVKPGIIDENRQGVDIIAMFNTYKARDFLQHGRVLESTFAALGYPEDIDTNGNVHILPEAAIATQTHCQRFRHLNHTEMIPLIARASTSTEIIAAQEATDESIAQEEN